MIINGVFLTATGVKKERCFLDFIYKWGGEQVGGVFTGYGQSDTWKGSGHSVKIWGWFPALPLTSYRKSSKPLYLPKPQLSGKRGPPPIPVPLRNGALPLSPPMRDSLSNGLMIFFFSLQKALVATDKIKKIIANTFFSPDCVPDTVLNTFYVLFHWMLTTAWRDRFYYCPHFSEEGTEAQRD